MSPNLLALARAYVALPGFRWRAGMRVVGFGDTGVVTNVWLEPESDDVAEIFVSYDEEVRPCPYEAPDFDGLLPDLTDDATGGVMLGMLGWHGFRVGRRGFVSDLPWCADLYFSDRPHAAGVIPSVNCATLAEACARVAVALGRAA